MVKEDNMIYKITMKFDNDIDELLEILDKYSVDYEIEEVYNNESEV
jgi:hypothetical protein